MTRASEGWQSLLHSLSAAGEFIEGPLGARDERERAEGYRHLTRVLSIATEMLLEKGDPSRPEFTRWMSPHRKIFGDNPGTIYDAAVISAEHTYRITGHRGTAAYLGVCVYGTAADGARRIIANRDDVDMTISEDGTFELVVGPAESNPDLLLEPDATDLMVRQYFVDPANEFEATYSIEAIPDAGPPPALTEDLIAQRLTVVGEYVRDAIEVEATLSALITSITPTQLRGGSEFVDAKGNSVDPEVDPSVIAKVMPTPAIQYAGSWFQDLRDDEMYVVQGSVPACRYWSIQLLSRWFESGDYQHHPVYLTGADITAGEDGRFRVVISATDPGEPNWICTTGLANASIAVRALLAENPIDVEFSREPHAGAAVDPSTDS